MKLYHFNSPNNYNFAQATHIGTWYPSETKICPECQTSRQTRISPLVIEWEAGSEIIGDFVWPGLNTDLVVVQKVKEAFEMNFREIVFGPVEFWQNPKLKRPTRNTSRSKTRIWLPYDGPMLWDILPTNWCHLDHPQSRVSIEKECSRCGKIIYNTPPWHQRHLVVDLETWNGEDIFHIYEYSGAIFCTEPVKEFVIQTGFTNVGFLEDGIIPA